MVGKEGHIQGKPVEGQSFSSCFLLDLYFQKTYRCAGE